MTRPKDDMTQLDGAVIPPRSTWLLRAQAGIVLVCVLGYLMDLAPTVNAAFFVVSGVTTALAMGLGPLVHRPDDVETWRRLLVACLLFAIGPVLRPGLGDRLGAGTALQDMFLLPGYLLAIGTMLRLLRVRRAADRDALLDVALVGIATFMVSMTYVVLPALHHSQLPGWLAVLASVYPVLDVILLAMMVLLAFTSRDHNPSLWLLGGAVAFLLAGDVAYNELSRQGLLSPAPIFDIPYLVGYGLLGASALHPSMATLATSQIQPVQAWSWQRLMLVGPALLVPAVLSIDSEPRPLAVRVVQAVGTALLAVAVLVRAWSAVQAQSESRLVYEHLASHDALTGLRTRSSLHDQLEEQLGQGRDVNVMFIDLDGFKLVNDSWGHAVGDELLVQVARRMRDDLPRQVLLSRAGGDEFLLVVPTRSHDPRGAMFAEHLIQLLSQPYALSVGDVVVTPSVGVTTSAQVQDPNGETLIRDADTAMYRAKDFGRSRAVAYDPSMGELVRDRVELDRALRKALPRGEMDVTFQPIVDLATGRLESFEALARWRRGDCGPSSPDAFIAAAEENGLILPIGDFVLGRALDEVHRWRTATPWDIGVNVNVSGRQLQDPGFTRRVLGALSQRGLPASALRLEITESTLIGDDATAAESLRELESAGVSTSVDDFGTGYSSLSYLSRLRVHEVKIDQSFVARITTRAEDHAIVRATLAMADALGLGVVAEGIETPQQWEVLLALGVPRGQGWLFGRPVGADDAAAMVTREWERSLTADALPPRPRPPTP